MATGTRVLSAAAICALMSGCSWAFMTKPPETVATPAYPIDCTTSRAAPVLDTICVGYFIANGIYLASVEDCSSAGFGQSCVSSSTKAGGLLLSAGLGLLCGFSAASGYGYAARCEEKKDLNALCITGDQESCRRLRPGWVPPAAGGSPPGPVSPPGRAPPVVNGCTKDTDCKGDRICLSGACVFPSDAVPPARPAKPPAPALPPPKLPQCERDADCEEGICYDGVCRR